MTLLLRFHSVIISLYVSCEGGRTWKEAVWLDFARTSQLA